MVTTPSPEKKLQNRPPSARCTQKIALGLSLLFLSKTLVTHLIETLILIRLQEKASERNINIPNAFNGGLKQSFMPLGKFCNFLFPWDNFQTGLHRQIFQIFQLVEILLQKLLKFSKNLLHSINDNVRQLDKSLSARVSFSLYSSFIFCETLLKSWESV